jgi:ankyrin repeat protein
MGEASVDVGAQELLAAVDSGDVAEVERLLASDPALAATRGPDGVSAILRARYHGHAWLAERLADAAGELDLFEAAALGRPDRIEALLDTAPAAVSAEAADGFTPLHLAAFFGHLEAAAVLLGRGAEADVPAGNGSRVRPLHSAAAGGHAAIAALLLERGADPDARQHGGYVPLHSAAGRGDTVTARLLIERGADRAIRADDGRRPVDVAAADSPIADLLRP